METLVNFRDIGGYKGSDGRKVKKKRLLRSGEVVDVAQADREKLVSLYQLKNIVDLRGQDEIAEKPDDKIEDVAYWHIDVMRDLKSQTASKANLMKRLNAEHAEWEMLDVYEKFILNKGAQNSYKQFIERLNATAEGATLFHCFAGKDRTGIAAAIVLTILGVHQDDIFEDYLLTNVQRVEANKKLIQDVKDSGFALTLYQIEALEVGMSVKEEYLRHAFDVIDETYGTFDNYVRNGLNVTDKNTDKLKQLYLEA